MKNVIRIFFLLTIAVITAATLSLVLSSRPDMVTAYREVEEIPGEVGA